MKDRDTLIRIYIAEFGLPIYKGAEYLQKLLQKYDALAAPDASDYWRLVEETAAEVGRSPDTVVSGIYRFLCRYAEKGKNPHYAAVWKKYTGWDGDGLPRARTAIQMACEGFARFAEGFGQGQNGPFGS